MDGWVKALISAASLSAILAAGIYIMNDQRQRDEDTKANRNQANAEIDNHVRDCRRYIDQWDSGARISVTSEFGSHAESVIRSCRITVELSNE